MIEIPKRPPTLEELAHSKLLSYVAYQFPQYVIGQMHLLIAAYLEAVERGDITRLMIWAPPRHGKCCDINSLLHMADGTLKKAGDAKVGDSIFGYDDGKLCTQTILATEPTRKLSKQITTRTGRSFIGSVDHPLLTFDGYKQLTELTLNDFLVTLHKEIDFNYEIDLNELKFITYMLFDGSCSAKHGRSFSKLDPIVIANFRKLCELFGITFTKSAGSDCDYYVGVQAIPLLQKYGIADEKSTTKRLPKEFFKVSLKQKWAFINIMFQTDGYFAQKAGQGGITLANKKLIQDIQTLLSMCGIATAMFYKPNNCSNAWGLTIGRSQLQKIYDNCDLGSKREQCAKILEKQGLSMIEAFPNKLGKTLKRTRENGFRCDNKKNITRERLERMAKVYPELNWYLEMDFIYDQIINIQNVGMRDLIHLQTTNTKNYIANGVVSHNTALVGEYFPAWYLGRNPQHHIIYTTYNQERGNDVGRRVRDQAINENFQRIFPNCNVLKDSKAISHFSTQQKGEYFNVGMGGAIVGRGADCLPAETILSVEIDGVKKELDIETIYSLLIQSNKIKVLSFDHQNRLPIYKNIIVARMRYTNELYQIITDSNLELKLTKNHPIYTILDSYVKAQFIQRGDKILIYDTTVKEDRINKVNRISTKSIPVYDIQVEGTNNFFANKILTHNCLIIDDPIKDRQEAESKTARKNVQNWYQAVAYTRVMPGGKIVVINTRWHNSDLSGYLMEEHAHENWAILDLKAIAEPGDIMKRKEGEALWPEFRDIEQLEVIKTALGPREWNAQFQQRPTALGGGRVKFEWINHYEQLPKPDEIQRIVASWDTAYKPEQINDPTACTVWIITATGYYLIDVRNKRLEFPDLVREVKVVHEIHHPSAHLIEGRATGQSLIQELKRSTRIPTVEISTKNINNEIRFDAITTLFESGKVWFPKQAHWLSEAEDQICSFPTAPHDDIADSTSQFLNWVNKPRYVPRPPSKLYWK